MRILVLTFLLIAAAPAAAGNLYKCVGSDEIPNYTNKKIPGANCVVVAKTAPAPAPAPVIAQAQASPVASPVKMAEVAGSETAAANTATSTATVATKIEAPTSAPKFLRMGSSTTYSYIDENGIKNFSSRRPKGVANVVATRIEFPIFSQPMCYACAITSPVSFGSVKLNTLAYANEIRAASLAYGVEEAVVRAIIHAESAYRPHVQSHKGAQGLMQLIPATAKRFGVSDSFDPAQNINGGVQYLSWLLRRYKQDLTLASAAYNAGEGAVDRYGGVPPYKETRLYVARVGQLAERYRKAL